MAVPTSFKAAGLHKELYAAQTLAASSLLCDDFNFDVSDAQHALTCGLYDRAQWTDGPDCRDFIFTTEDLSSRIRHVEVDARTAASDRQPIFIELAD